MPVLKVSFLLTTLPEKISLDEFTDMIMAHIKEMYDDSQVYDFNEDDVLKIQEIADKKYSTWDWNFGYQAKYTFEKMIHTNGGNIEFHLVVDKGEILDCKIYGDYFNTLETHDIENALKNILHREDEIRNALSKFNIDDYFKNVTLDEIVAGLF